MRKHTPTLYPHPEINLNDDDVDEEPEDEEEDTSSNWIPPQPHRQLSYNVASMSSLKVSRSPTAFLNGGSSNSTNTSNLSNPSRYSDVYSQFLKRYRSQTEYTDDSHDEVDNPYPQWGVTHLVETGDRDDDDLPGSAHGSEPLEPYSGQGFETDILEPTTAEDRERLEWQSMLASVLGGDVLKSEKSRIQVALESSSLEANNRHMDIWMGLRAKFRGRKEEEERRLLEERRRQVVDPVLNEIMTFRVKDDSDAAPPLHQVNSVIQRLDVIQSLYPNLKTLYIDKPVSASPEFQARRDTLITWSAVLTSLRQQLNLLRKWTGSVTLDVNQPNTNPEQPINTNMNGEAVNDNENVLGRRRDTSTFVERVLKEETIQRTFEKGSLTTIHALIASARDAQVNLASKLKELNLPTFEAELVLLISFPTRLIQDCLRVRLDYATKVKDPDILIIDQMLEDFRLTIGLACMLKRQYESFCFPDPGGNWNPPNCISDDYDAVLLQGLNFFFRLINWKLKGAAKDMHFKKETDLLDAQWATFNDVSLTVTGGASAVAEQLCSLVHRLMYRVTQNFRKQVRFPISSKTSGPYTPNRAPHSPANKYNLSYEFHDHYVDPPSKARYMTNAQMLGYYERILDGAKVRHRKLQRYSHALCQRFNNSAEYSLEEVSVDSFIAGLIDSDHFLVYTQSFEEDGTYIVACRSLRDRPEYICQMLRDAFHVNPIWGNDFRASTPDGQGSNDNEFEATDDTAYLLILSPRMRFLWTGLVLMLPFPRIDLELRDNRVRLIADGPELRLALARQCFAGVFAPVDEEGQPYVPPLVCIAEQMAHLPHVNRELRKINRAADRLAEAILESVHHVRKVVDGVPGFPELLESWYSFAAEHGQHAQKYMKMPFWSKFNRMLIRMAISWVSLICDDCDPTDRRTFRWAVSALEFALLQTKRTNILRLPSDQFELLRQKVASCMTLLISHFDILGARSNLEAKREKERQEELMGQQFQAASIADQDDLLKSLTPEAEMMRAQNNFSGFPNGDRSIRRFRDDVLRALQRVDEWRSGVGAEQRVIGRVLDAEKPEDRSLQFLASSSSNFSVRWQQGKFIGAGAFGSVYTAVNLESGSVMAVKEIRYQDVPGTASLFQQIQAELRVMEMLHHPNIVEYYGMEVHRDKIYIFEEYCEGGSLAANLEVGRFADEHIVQVYTMQMLEGLHYLHSQAIVHRDIKPDNILLDHQGVLKFVDFGAAKVIAKNSRTVQRSKMSATSNANAGGPGGLGNSLTGTPMYMSPEVIKNEKSGRHGAMDIWSMGCVVLECATGRKPWSNLDNEWAIMFHIGVATQHPPLPEKDELSELGINFIKQCLILDPMRRPTAKELMDHPWMVQFMETLRSYEEEELAASPPADVPPQEDFKGASVAWQAAVIQEKEVETINCASPSSSDVISSSSDSPGQLSV